MQAGALEPSCTALDIAMSPKRRARSDALVAPEGAAVDVLVTAALKTTFKTKLRRGGWNYDALDIECSK